MAITTVSGCTGDFAATGVNMKVKSWTMNVDFTVVETTGLTDCSTTHEPIKAVTTFGATGVVQYDAASTAPIVAAALTGDMTTIKGAFTLTATTGCTYVGTGILTAWDVARTRDEDMIVNCSFIASGDIVQTWDEA